jgi:PKD repeat protein
LIKHANFSSPLTITNPYVVVISNPSATPMSLVFNDYNAAPADGAQEWLVSADLFGTWTRSYNVNVGGVLFDADGLFEPHVSYEITASFLNDNPCLDPGLAVNFTNQSSPINFNRMYNQAEYLGVPEFSFTWDYGDGSPTENVIDATHTYASAASYSVTLTDTVYGWTTNCITDTTVTIGPGTVPFVAFTSAESGLTSDFTNGSTAGPDATYSWDFGDGSTSTTMNPSHTYATDGTYNVCLTITDSCLTELSCQSVTVTSCTTPVADFTVAGTSPTFDFTNTSTTTGAVTYSWDFDDGNTSTLMNPSHTYTSNGTPAGSESTTEPVLAT